MISSIPRISADKNKKINWTNEKVKNMQNSVIKRINQNNSQQFILQDLSCFDENEASDSEEILNCTQKSKLYMGLYLVKI